MEEPTGCIKTTITLKMFLKGSIGVVSDLFLKKNFLYFLYFFLYRGLSINHLSVKLISSIKIIIDILRFKNLLDRLKTIIITLNFENVKTINTSLFTSYVIINKTILTTLCFTNGTDEASVVPKTLMIIIKIN